METLGTVLGLVAHRVQFTPDLMPADILGAEVLETGPDGSRAFRFIDGPIFCQLMMADEINRASPRTQSALLQAMQEKEVSVAGQRRILPAPFHVLATQNPIEQEGTYPLPEAQLDRFLLQIDVGYPERAAGARDHPRHHRGRGGLRRAGLRRGEPDRGAAADPPAAGGRGGGGEDPRPGALGAAGHPGRAPPRSTHAVSWGPGPRAAQALMLAIRARALIQGRLVPGLDDVAALAHPVLIHRMALGFAARAEGQTLDRLIARLVGEVMGVEAAA